MKAGPTEPVGAGVVRCPSEVTLPDGTTFFWFGPVEKGPKAELPLCERRADEDPTAVPDELRLGMPVPDELVRPLDLVEDERTPELNGRLELERRWLELERGRPVPVELEPLLDLVEEERTPELKGRLELDRRPLELERGRPVPVELKTDVEFQKPEEEERDETKPELDRPVGVMLLPLGRNLLELEIDTDGVTGRVELIELLLLSLLDELPVEPVTPVMKPEPAGVNAETSPAMARATKAMSKLTFIVAEVQKN